MPVRIEDVQNSKSGKSYRVRIGDKWYGAGLKYNKDQPPIMEAIGRMIEVETEVTDFGPWITAWRFSMDQTLPAGARPITPHQGQGSAGWHNNPDPKYQGTAQTTEKAVSGRVAPDAAGRAQSEPARQLSAEELKVVNGIVMAALQHGKIEELEQVQVWMKGVARTLREI